MQGPTILSQYPWVSQGVTCVDEFTVAFASPAPYGNTKEILVYNTSDTYPVYIRAVDSKVEQATISIVLNTFPTAYLSAGDTIIFDPGGLSYTLVAVAGAPGPGEFQLSTNLTTQMLNIRDAINDGVNNPGWAAAVNASSVSYVQDGVDFHVITLTVRQAFALGDSSNGYEVQLTSATTLPVYGLPWTISPGDFSGSSPQSGFTAGGLGTTITAADLTIANALYLPPLAAITLAIGVEGERNDLNGPNSPSGLQVAFLCGTGGTNVALSVTYVQSSGGGGTGNRTGLGG